MPFSLHLDLLSVGTVVAANLIIGSAAFYSDRKNATTAIFFALTGVVSAWSTLNYLSYQITDLNNVLWVERLVLFFAVPMSILFVLFIYTFPQRTWVLSKMKTVGVALISSVTMIVTLTPYVFSGVYLAPEALTPQPIVGPGMALFVIVAVLSIPFGLYVLIRKFLTSEGDEQRQVRLLLIGVSIMFACIIVFDFIFPTYFQNTSFIPFSALFVFPFIGITAYAIRVKHLFNVKVFSTALFVFALSITSFLEIIFADTLQLLILRTSIFVLVLIYGLNVMRGVLREVEQREKIQQLAVELELSNEQLSEFMSLATHEIRNPATFIKGYTAGALEGDLGELSPALRDGMQKLYIRANDIIHLGNQYLNKSKLELNRISFDFVPTDLRKIIEDLVHEFEPVAAQQGVTLVSQGGADGDYTIPIDTGKIKEVFANIIDNSIKYTQKGSVTVSLSRTDTGVKVQVVDTGVGIPEEVIPKLFKKFSRADAQKANILGTGLGLYISKIFIDAHHGTITVESAGEGKGSTFTVELPFTQPEVAGATQGKPLAERVESGMLKPSPEPTA